MRKLLLTLAVLCGTVSAWAQTSLRISDGLLATQENGQYKWTSPTLAAPTEGLFNKIRVTFLKTSNNEKPAGFPCVAIAEFYLYDKAGNAVALTADKFSSNATQSDEGKMSAICDGATAKQEGEGDYDWYWHSQWHGTASPYGYHYLEINVAELKADLSEYEIGWVTRREQASPADVIISTGATTEEAAKNANIQMLPEVSTEIVKLYTIKSVRSKKFLAYDETKAKPQQINSANNNAYWYFTQGADGKVVMHNLASGKVLGTNFEMADAGEWYVSPAEYRPGVVFSKTGIIANDNCIDDQGNHTTIGSWKHVSGDNEGTTWLVEEVVGASVDVPVLSLNNMKIKSIGEAVTEIAPDKWYILNNVGRGNYVSQEGNNWKMRATSNIVVGNLAEEKAGYLFKITKNGDYYNIMSGNGKFFQLGYNSASTSATPVNFDIRLISDNNSYLFDKDHGYVADGQETGNNFVGWSTSAPTSAGGNDSYRILPVELLDASEIIYLKEQLSEAIADAQEIYNMIGQGVGKYTAPEGNVEQFADIVTFCESIDGNTSIDDVNGKMTELENLIASVQLNMPIVGNFYRIKGGKHTSLPNHYITANTNSDGGRIALKAEGNDASTVYYYADGKLLAYGSGLYFGLSSSHYVFATVDGTKPASEITFAASPREAGAYTIKSADRYVHYKVYNGEAEIDRCADDDHAEHDWFLEEVTSLPFTFKDAALGFATFNAPVAVELPEGISAYIGELNMDNNTLQMYRLDGNQIPANTAVLLRKEGVTEDETVNFTVVSNVEADFGGVTNSLVGTVAAENLDDTKNCYSLQKSNTTGKVGFYSKTTGTKGGFKAWVETEKTEGARVFTIIFDGEDATGIKEALGLENENVEIYDLSGRRLDKPAKGVNIIGGKTVIVR